MGVTHNGLGQEKVDIRALGLLISMYQNKSSKVLQNTMKTFLLFFERL